MSIVLDGTTGITTPGLTNTGSTTIVALTTTGNTILGDASTDTLNVGNGNLVTDASGNVGIGSTTAKKFVVNQTGATGYFLSGEASGTEIAYWYYDANAIQFSSKSAGRALTFLTADTERMRIDSSGNLLVGTTSTLTSSATTKVHVGGSIIAGNSDSGYLTTAGSQQLMHKPAAEGNATNYFGNNGSTGFAITFASTAAYGANGAASGMAIGKNSSTNRSINAGGTINASGADYAEYMTKSGDFILAKGDVVGIDANGKLTNVYADAVSFVVKSTDPSYVGGDTWGVVEQTADNKKPGLTPEELEAARKLVDRIAFSGQVPVNVIGATAGQYIIPVNDNGAIKGEAISNPTFEQYQIAVGKVIAIESDGRAKIIVKVA